VLGAILVGCATQASKFGLAAAVVIVVAVGVGGGIATRHRWAQLPSEVSTHGGRAQVWRVAFDAWDEHRLGGSGPGSFKLLLPGIAATKEPQLFPDWIVTPYQPGRPVTIWMYAHDDPLQTLAEWGLIGAALWSAVLAWPLVCGLRSLRDRVRGGAPLPAVTLAGLLALGALLVHSLVDFPLQIFAIELTAGAWAAVLIAA
jgi:O-antigen ligase